MFFAIKSKSIFYNVITLFLVLFMNTQNALTQSSSESSSPYYFGAIAGYSGLLKDSKLAESFNSKDFINGYALGFFLDYKLSGTNSYLQFQTENNIFNFQTNLGDNNQNLNITTIGLKMYIPSSENLYFSIGTGILTNKNIETQMIMTFNLGYDLFKSKIGNAFLQIGVNTLDIEDKIITFKLGCRLNL